MAVHEPMSLAKERRVDFLKSLEIPVAGPVAAGTDDLEYRIAPPEEMLTDGFVNSAISPVRFIYPQTQVLWKYALEEKPRFIAEDQAMEMAIFGIRSCDVTAFRYLERFFARPPAEDSFAEAASKVLLVSLACQEPGEDCFCVCCDGGPFLEDRYDIQLTDLGDRYLMEIGSERGAAAARRASSMLRPAPKEDVGRRKRLAEETLEKFRITSHMATGVRKLTSRQVAEELWGRLAARCIECGGCAFVCPVCTCFDVADMCDGDHAGRRERTRDCCQYAGYSREASGFNPRPDKMSRFKRRFYHKLSYFYIQQDGMHGCVGCGRCVSACFGGVDMPAVVNAIREERIAADA